jgi:hypothetical protein
VYIAGTITKGANYMQLIKYIKPKLIECSFKSCHKPVVILARLGHNMETQAPDQITRTVLCPGKTVVI